MLFTISLLVLAARISMCSDTYGFNNINSVFLSPIVEWCDSLPRIPFSTLEVKFITSGPCSDDHAQVFGSVFTVGERSFWQQFSDLARKNIDGNPLYSRKFNKSVQEALLRSPYVEIEGLSPLDKDHIKSFFPSNQGIAWHVGPTDFSLQYNIPGTIILCPGSDDYALHFIPARVSNKPSRDKGANVEALRTPIEGAQPSLTHLKYLAEAMVDSIDLLLEKPKELK